MNRLDSSGWIEYFAEGPNAEGFGPVVEDTANLLVPTIVQHEVYRWADREGGEPDHRYHADGSGRRPGYRSGPRLGASRPAASPAHR